MEDFFEWTQLQEGRHPDEIWICLPLSDADGIKQTLNSFGHYCSNIRIVPDVISLSLLNHTVSEALGIPVYDLSTSPATTYMLVVKTILDVFLSLFIIALFSPLFFVIALAVKITSRGPVFYKQKRLGWNGVEIVVYKFRSMYFLGSSENEFLQASVNDKRVTSVGRFLRRTSLDELPQFFNVLQGRMSIVGPRPHAIAHNEHYKELIPRYMHRHKVMPGITGWAQINGLRGETDTLEKMRKRIEYDLYYIENMSLWLDLRIIVMTIFKGFVHKNAY
jgi:putative colanic acid biosynthesis UDP-glucose lipid carrier transferase